MIIYFKSQQNLVHGNLVVHGTGSQLPRLRHLLVHVDIRQKFNLGRGLGIGDSAQGLNSWVPFAYEASYAYLGIEKGGGAQLAQVVNSSSCLKLCKFSYQL